MTQRKAEGEAERFESQAQAVAKQQRRIQKDIDAKEQSAKPGKDDKKAMQA
jgi:hypothetical protein